MNQIVRESSSSIRRFDNTSVFSFRPARITNRIYIYESNKYSYGIIRADKMFLKTEPIRRDFYSYTGRLKTSNFFLLYKLSYGKKKKIANNRLSNVSVSSNSSCVGRHVIIICALTETKMSVRPDFKNFVTRKR